MPRTLTCCIVMVWCSVAQADELSDKVCPILEKVASELGDKADYAVQAELVMQIGGAYDFDGEQLREVSANIDASTTEVCPAARSAILDRVSMTSLEQAIR